MAIRGCHDGFALRSRPRNFHKANHASPQGKFQAWTAILACANPATKQESPLANRREIMDQTLKKQLLTIFEAGLNAVRPDQALLRHLKLQHETLVANGKKYPLGRGKIIVLGAGKGAAPMARALENLLGGRIDTGLVVVKYGHGLDCDRIRIVEAAHPVPDEAGAKAATEILALARQCGPNDLVICLLTGGASALLPAPAEGLDLGDIQKTTSLLLASGAEIAEVNALRKHLSALAGGQLAKACNGATVLSVIVSDVPGDNLEAIASGPTVPDSSTYAQCLAIIDKYGLGEKLPPKVVTRLENGAAGKMPETPKPDAPFFKTVSNIIVASNAQALAAAAKKARELGLTAQIESDAMSGEASLRAVRLINKAKAIATRLGPESKDFCLLAGGETTVTIKGAGMGGRNQEMALAAARELAGSPNISALFAGTDGTDGPTDAAGGFAFGDSWEKLDGKGQDLLANNDSYKALEISGDLLKTGPTRTNVMDLAIIVIRPQA